MPSLLVAGSLSAQTTATPAPAAPSDSTPDAVELPAVTVEGTAQPALASPKFTAPLLDTPQTVSVIPQSVFNQQGATNLTEVLRNTPGISFNAGENGFSSGAGNFSMRGFDASDSILIDGSRDQGNYLRDTFNTEQVEVAKGPAADNGRGSAGGYVNMVTKSPLAQSFVAGTATFGFDEENGTEASHRATLDVNQALTDHAAVRLNVVGQEGGVAGRDVTEKNLWGVAPSFVLGLGTPTRLVLSYQHVEQNDIPDYGVPSSFVDGFAPSGTTIRHDNPGLPSVDRTNFYGLSSDYDDVTNDAFLARIEHDLTADLKLSNQTRYSVTDREAIYTVVTNQTVPGTVATGRQAFDRENTAISNLTNLTAKFDTGSLEHTLATGLEVAREKSESGRDFAGLGLGGGANTSFANPDPDRAPGADLNPANSDTVKVDSVGVYVNDTVKFSPKWQATAGARVEHSKVNISSSDGTVDYDRQDTALSGKLGLVFKPVKNGSIYGAAGVATLSPGAVFLSNPDISRGGGQSFPNLIGQQGEDSRLQKSLNYELGTKWAFFDSRLTTGLALFRTEKHDVGMANATTFLGYGEQTVQGIELSAVGNITEGWSVFGGIVFMDSERHHSSAIDAALADGPTDGDELAFTPKISANLWTTYRFPFGLTLGGGLQYVGASYVGRPDNVDRSIPNGFNGRMPDYIIFNGLVAYEVTKNITVRLNVENIADELYANNANWSARRVTLGAPRSYLLSADFKF